MVHTYGHTHFRKKKKQHAQLPGRFHVARWRLIFFFNGEMWFKVRSMDGRKSVHISHFSKLTKIEELREHLVEHFDAEPNRQRLFHRGKQVRNS